MSALIRPPALRTGDTVAIVPTARAITLDELRDGIGLLEHWGLRVSLGEGIGRKHFQFAGTDAERAADLQAAIDDPGVRAIWCARGGYGTMRLMERIDLSGLKRSRKWIVGFSDITVLHNALHNMGLCSLHAQMPFMIGSKSEECRETLRAALFGEDLIVRSSLSDDAVRSGTNRVGQGEGTLIGGNLSLLYGLRGTPHDVDPNGKILLIEDLDELLYHVDRMMINLKLSGWLSGLAGLVVGGMSEMHNKNEADPFGRTAEQIVIDAVGGAGYPICFGFPSGHVADNRALILGERARLNVTAGGATLSFGRDA